MMHECTDGYQNAAGTEDGAKLIVCSLQLPCSQTTAASRLLRVLKKQKCGFNHEKASMIIWF